MSLTDKRSVHKAPKLQPGQVEALLAEVPGYQVDAARSTISKEYSFPDFYETIAFVNALAWICNTEDHHPELAVSYDRCRIRFNTHSVGGVSLNDFICAAKTEALIGA